MYSGDQSRTVWEAGSRASDAPVSLVLPGDAPLISAASVRRMSPLVHVLHRRRRSSGRRVFWRTSSVASRSKTMPGATWTSTTTRSRSKRRARPHRRIAGEPLDRPPPALRYGQRRRSRDGRSPTCTSPSLPSCASSLFPTRYVFRRF